MDEFRAAARERYIDGNCLAAQSRRTGAIYVWGYTVEMLLKAAVFKVLASSPGEEIELDDLQAAKKLAKDLGCNWKENYHDLVGWAEFLVGLRSDLPACGYTNLAFGAGVIARAGRVYALWRESLRYHKNVASAREMGTVREAVDWFVTHQHDL